VLDILKNINNPVLS